MKPEVHSKFLEPLEQAGAEIYEVGGTVRDRLLGIPHKDKDLLVRLLSIDQIKSLLKPFGKVAMVGKVFGVLKFTPHLTPETTLDIALPRKEISTGPHHRDFEVTYDPHLPLEEDLKRRDFTVNAMAYDLKNERLLDPLNGQEDLKNKILRQV
ncbi:MAG: polynucleotide adenylyltransferase, partial [Deltaproteobacteria bacterium]|nr:polynucleotide adenylyltransferase [Deltaproteobacteria bacterium]